jgi:tetratricopeptide (TPR) repeat protein
VLLGLGKALHIDALARIGAEWIGKGLNLAPALSKSILGAQETALRALLREFREGDLEKALRRALPFDDRVPRGSGASSNFNLPTHNTRYSLSNILAGSSGPAGYWLGGGDVWAELRKEYQKQAERAAGRGDHRRAAFIYGKLLHDFRSAANVLSRGGLHEDAAVLFLKKLGDKQAAAREYEASGNFDVALDLYRQTGQHGEAGDLLRRIGEEPQAIAEYQQGAEKLTRPPGSYLQAGDFLLNRAQLPELALNYFESGWRKRPETNALPCALRMLGIYAQQKSAKPLLDLIAQADDHLRQTIPSDPAVEFYNEVARLAEQPILSGHGEDLQDRALTGLAHQMRERAEARQVISNLVSKHMGMTPIWKPALVSDAHYAVKLASSRAQSLISIPARSPLITLPARTPKVLAVCWSPGSGDIFVGFPGEEVFCYNSRRGETKAIPFEREKNESAPIGLSLATDTNGQVLAVLSWGHSAEPYSVEPTLRVFLRRMEGFVLGKVRVLRATDTPWLCPLIIGDDERLVGVWNGEQLAALRTADLNPVVTLQPSLDDGVHGAFLLPWILWRPYSQKVILFGNNAAELQGRDGKSQVVPLGWSPFASVDNSLCRQMVDWRMTGPRMELLGVDDSGNLHWSVTTFEENNVLKKSEMRTYNKNGPIRAAAFLQPGHIAAVGDQGIQWLQTGTEFRLKGMTSIRFPAAVACFPNYQGRELIVINSAGTIENVPFAP